MQEKPIISRTGAFLILLTSLRSVQHSIIVIETISVCATAKDKEILKRGNVLFFASSSFFFYKYRMHKIGTRLHARAP